MALKWRRNEAAAGIEAGASRNGIVKGGGHSVCSWSRPSHSIESNDNDMPARHEKNEDRSTRPSHPMDAGMPRVRSILVVDDNADAAESLGELLKAWGHEVTVTHDGPAALAALQHTLPDIALLDIGMPAMDGYELAAHLRFQPGCEELPIVAVTGSGGPEDARRSRAKGFSAHLVKPVSAASLLSLLK
jgi:CheY-like chemotaxis protein